MTKFLLGVAVGYVFSDVIDELIGMSKKTVGEKAYKPPEAPEAPVTQP